MDMTKKILVIDDDARYLELVKYMLEEAGYEVFTETDSLRVAGRIAANRPDVIVTDVLMPAMDGVELGMMLKTNQETAIIPVVYVSAWTGAPERDLPRGAIRLLKPFSPQELVDSIDKAIEESSRKEAQRVRSA